MCAHIIIHTRAIRNSAIQIRLQTSSWWVLRRVSVASAATTHLRPLVHRASQLVFSPTRGARRPISLGLKVRRTVCRRELLNTLEERTLGQVAGIASPDVRNQGVDVRSSEQTTATYSHR